MISILQKIIDMQYMMVKIIRYLQFHKDPGIDFKRVVIFVTFNACFLPERFARSRFRAEITAHAGVEERGAAY